MYIYTLVTFLFTTLAFTSAGVTKPLASDEVESSIAEKRDVPFGVYICEVENWSGACNYHAEVNPGTCYQRSLTAVASFGPDKGLMCTLYSGPNCGRYGAVKEVPGIAWPGLNPTRDGQLRNGWGNQVVESWSCDNGGGA